MSADIGFAEISEICRNERRSKSLTKVRPDFYEKAEKYLEGLKKGYAEMGKNPGSAQAMMLQDEIKKVVKRMEQIYCHRERKISLAALSGVSGGEPPKNLTQAERKLYQSLVEVLSHFRQCPSGVEPPPMPEVKKLAAEEKKPAPKPEMAAAAEDPEKKDAAPPKVLRLLKDVPAFAGEDRVYNLKKADIVTLPASFAEVLVSRGAAKVVEG